VQIEKFKSLMGSISKYCIAVNVVLFGFAFYAGGIELQILSLSNIALFLLYFIIQK